ncbi:MAG: hypothetical protein ACRDLR_03985, partial [Gaiellaceae bacterium]
MSLLLDVMANAIDEGYLDAAKRRAAGAAEPVARPVRSRRRTAFMVAVVLAAAGLLFAMSAVATHRGAAAAKRDRADLVRQIDQHDAANETMRQTLSALQEQVKNARDVALSASDKGSALTTQLRALALVTGAVAVEMQHLGVGEAAGADLDVAVRGRDPFGPRGREPGQRVGTGPGDDRDRHRRAIVLDQMGDQATWTVIYDGDCGVCATLLALLL